jgi:hypothetical protein
MSFLYRNFTWYKNAWWRRRCWLWRRGRKWWGWRRRRISIRVLCWWNRHNSRVSWHERFFSEPGRKFLSKVWKEYKPIRVDGIVTTVECKHCARNICAERKHGTSLLRKRLKRCKGRRKALIVSYSSGRLFHQRWPDNRPGSGPNPTPILNYYWLVQSHSSPHLFDSTQSNPIHNFTVS